MFKKHMIAGFMGLALAGGAVACERRESTKIEIKSDNLADRLDKVENDWIRLKGELQGKSEAEQELAVAKDEIEEELADAKKALKELGSDAKKEGKDAKASLEKAIDKLEASIEKAKNKAT